MPSQDELARLESTFKSLDQSTKLALSNAAGSPMVAAIAALVLAYEREGITQLSASQISRLLEEAGVALTPTQVTKAFARAGAQITRASIEGVVHFRAMTSARSLAEPILASGPIQVVRIEAGTPRSARKKLEDMLSPLGGTIRICDPYYGLRTFDALALIPNSCHVRFLTSRTNEKATTLAGPIKDFQREHPRIHLRALAHPTTLHDRYVLSSDALMLLGHGIKDIGSKESFVVVVSASYAGDLLHLLESSFEQHWAKASDL